MNLTLLAAVAALADPTATAKDLSWMAGYWLDCDGKHVAESWTWLGGDTLYASIEGLSGDSYDGMAWTFQKAEAGETCAGG